MRPVSVWCLALGAVAILAGCDRQVVGAGAPAATLGPCGVPGVSRPTECGTVDVPENRKAPGRTLSLRVVVARATATPGRDAVFFLTGGPGTAATTSAGFLAREFAALDETHDFVFVDQRGTGGSHPLKCPDDEAGGLAPMFRADVAAECRALLESSADLRAYTTSDAVEDLDAVRAALHYERISLHGSSYGTRVGWTYAARFPERTKSVVLHGPAPPGFLIPLPFSRGLDAALAGVIQDCRGDTACAGRFPRFAEAADSAFKRLETGPVRVGLAEGTLSDFSHGELAEAVRYMLYSPMDARRLPLLLSAAANGDYAPLARASMAYRRALQRDGNMGMYFAVTCAEDIPFLDENAIVAATRNSRLGDYRVRQQSAACSVWPRSAAAAPQTEALSVPTLLLVGAYDPATPEEWARRGAALLSNGRLVVIPHGGHTFTGLGVDRCLQRMITTFVREGAPRSVDADCVAQARRPPFLLQ